MRIPQLFHKKSTGNPQGKIEYSKTDHVLLMARLDRLESDLRLVRTEWADVYDKVMHLYDRVRKRIKAAEDRDSATNPPEQVLQQPLTRALVLERWRRMNGQ